MHVDQARKVLLIRAVEETDADVSLLSDSMRRQAERRAREDADPRSDPEAFIAARADRLYGLLATESSTIRLAGRPLRFKRLLIALSCLIALCIGFGLNELGGERTINILSVPILLLIAWNVVICLIGAIALFVSWRSARTFGIGNWLSEVVHWLIDRLSLRHSRSGRKARLAAHAVQEYFATWFQTARKLHVSQVRLLLHTLAALLVIGAVGGMYVRGFAYEYQATWESTFFNADGVRNILAVVLGPASALMGKPVPDVPSLAAMQTTPVAAADWIHRYALTTVLFVIIPRTLLAGVDFLRLRRLQKTFPVDWQTDPYVLGLLASDRGKGLIVMVQPYSFHPSEKALGGLKRQLRVHFGHRAELQIADVLEYGEEIDPSDERPIAAAGQPMAAGVCHVLLFNAAQTPEHEVHGSLIAQFSEAASKHGELFVIIDETAFKERLGDDPQFDERLEQRRSAWRRIVQEQGIDPHVCSLEAFDARALAPGN